ncbi:hypothetical protein L3V83_13720 [Thiotrichales bacterium 19X7-9]|nr:hypothetical protein [Thiotrichales bacterium 19X7-9]
MAIKLNESQQDFIASAALIFDGMIAESEANLNEVSEILSFLLSLYGFNAPITEADKSVLRQAYKIIQKNHKHLKVDSFKEENINVT